MATKGGYMKPIGPRAKGPKTPLNAPGMGHFPKSNAAEIAVGNVSAQRQAKWGSPRKKRP
jgi:hypothetical protein